MASPTPLVSLHIEYYEHWVQYYQLIDAIGQNKGCYVDNLRQ